MLCIALHDMLRSILLTSEKHLYQSINKIHMCCIHWLPAENTEKKEMKSLHHCNSNV